MSSTLPDYEQWKSIAQKAELAHWQLDREDALRHFSKSIQVQLTACSAQIMRRFDFSAKTCMGQTILDVGCGPTGRLNALEGEFWAIEPLANQYRPWHWPWWEKYVAVIAQPVEVFLPTLAGRFDGVISLNVLDHIFDFEEAVVNIASYLKGPGFALLSFDCHEANDIHPVKIDICRAEAAFCSVGLTIERCESGHCCPTPSGEWRDNWGEGTAWHWWLRK